MMEFLRLSEGGKVKQQKPLRMGYRVPSVIIYPFDLVMFAQEVDLVSSEGPKIKDINQVFAETDSKQRFIDRSSEERIQASTALEEGLARVCKNRVELETRFNFTPAGDNQIYFGSEGLSEPDPDPAQKQDAQVFPFPRAEYMLYSFLVYSHCLPVEELHSDWILPHRHLYQLLRGKACASAQNRSKLTPLLEWGKKIYHKFFWDLSYEPCFLMATLFVILVVESRDEVELRALTDQLFGEFFSHHKADDLGRWVNDLGQQDQIIPMLRTAYIIKMLVYYEADLQDPHSDPVETKVRTWLADIPNLITRTGPKRENSNDQETHIDLDEESDSLWSLKPLVVQATEVENNNDSFDCEDFSGSEEISNHEGENGIDTDDMWSPDFQKPIIEDPIGHVAFRLMHNTRTPKFLLKAAVTTYDESEKVKNILPDNFQKFYSRHLFGKCCDRDGWLSICLLCAKYMHKESCMYDEKHLELRNCFNHAMTSHGGQAIFVDCHQGYIFYYDEQRINLIKNLYVTQTGLQVPGDRARPYRGLEAYKLNRKVLEDVERIAIRLGLRNKMFETELAEKTQYTDRFY